MANKNTLFDPSLHSHQVLIIVVTLARTHTHTHSPEVLLLPSLFDNILWLTACDLKASNFPVHFYISAQSCMTQHEKT